MAQRNTTKSNDVAAATSERLTPQRCTGVDLLVSGKTLTDVAAALEVDRATVSGWVNHNPVFLAALNQRRQEAFDSMVERLRGLLPQALDVIEQQLKGENPLPAALQILKSCNLATGVGRPSGPATVEAAERELRQREIEQAATALTEADVQAAVRQREQTRLLAELTTFP